MAATPQITLSYDLVDFSGAQIGSANNPAYLRIALAGFGAVLPRINGTALIGKAASWPGDIPYIGGGSQSINLWGNDVITPLGTYYSISVLDDKRTVIQSAEYQFVGTQTIDLSTATPMAPSPGWVNVAGIIVLTFKPNLILPGTGSQMSIYQVTLTADVISNAFAALTPGIIIFEIQQDAVGNHQWLWPSIVQGGGLVNPLPLTESTQMFLYDGVAVRALGPMTSGSIGAAEGIQSINNDYTQAQRIVGTAPITVNTANGVTTIAIASSLSSITMSPSSVVGGNNSTGTVTLTMPAPPGGAVVLLSSNNSAAVTVPPTVTVAANQTTVAFTAVTHPVGTNTPVTISGTYSGGTQNATLTVNAAQPIYGGPGQPGATSSVTLSGTQVTLSTGDVINQLQTTAEAVGQTWTFTGLNNQCVYLLLFGGSHSFSDAGTGLPFAFNAPIAVTLSGVAMHLYQSTNALFGTSRPKIAG